MTPSTFYELHILYLLAISAKEQGEYNQARLYLEKALELCEDMYELLVEYSSLLKSDYFKDYQGALETHQKIVKYQPYNHEAYRNAADCIRVLFPNDFQKHGLAKKYYERAIELNPQDHLSLYGFALLMSNNYYKDYLRAKELMILSLQANDRFADAHFNYAVLLKKYFDEFDEAESHFKIAIELNPDEAQFCVGLANLYVLYMNTRLDEARQLYEKAINLKPEYLSAYLNWGGLFFKQGNVAKAKEKYNQALKIDPHCAKASKGLAIIELIIRQDVSSSTPLSDKVLATKELLELIKRQDVSVSKDQETKAIEKLENLSTPLSDKVKENSFYMTLLPLIKKIVAKRKGELAVFCGAGISYNSGLPLAYDLMRYILCALGITNKKEQDSILDSKIPLEKFIQLIINNSTETWKVLQSYKDKNAINEYFSRREITSHEKKFLKLLNSNVPYKYFIDGSILEDPAIKLLKMFEEGEPNTNHLLIANLVKDKCISHIYTTNFDTLIEKALTAKCNLVEKPKMIDVWLNELRYLYETSPGARNSIKNEAGDDYLKYFHEKLEPDRFDYSVYALEEEFTSDLFQLDKSKAKVIKLHGSVDIIESIRITLDEINNPSFKQEREKILTDIFRNSDTELILVLGYSCSDIFDISPVIESLDSDKEVIIIDHMKDDQIIKDLSEMSRLPFKNFRGKYIACDFDVFINLLWEEFGFKNYPGVLKTSKELWKDNVDQWEKSIDTYTKSIIAAELCAFINKHKKATEYLELAKRCEVTESDALHIKQCIQCQELKDFDKAIKILNKVRRRDATYYCEKGNIFSHTNKENEAKACYEKSIEIDKNLNNMLGVANNLNNIGILFMKMDDFDKAITYLHQSSEIKKNQDVDIEDLISTNLNLGMCYYKKKEYFYAHKFLSEGIAIVEKLNFGGKFPAWYILLSEVYANMGDYSHAIDCLEKARLINRTVQFERESVFLNRLQVLRQHEAKTKAINFELDKVRRK